MILEYAKIILIMEFPDFVNASPNNYKASMMRLTFTSK